MDENLVDEVVDTKVVPTDKPVDQVDKPIDKPVDAKPTEKPADKPADKPVDTKADDKKVDPKAKSDAKLDKPADKTVDPTWPADWREKMAGGDAKKLAKLSRYASPVAAVEAGLSAQAKISSGEYKSPLGKDAKPEEIAAWRAENGIPEKPEGYTVKDVPEGDKEAIKTFLNAAHGANMSGDMVNASIGAYYSMLEAAKAARENQDIEIQKTSEDALRAEWGNEYRINQNLYKNLLSGLGVEAEKNFVHGRLADGTPIGSSPEVLKFLVGLARERNPVGVVTPSGVATDSSVQSEIDSIEKTMRENRSAYNKNEPLQARYRELLDWRQRNTKKAA